jgi:hypothetical protein
VLYQEDDYKAEIPFQNAVSKMEEPANESSKQKKAKTMANTQYVTANRLTIEADEEHREAQRKWLMIGLILR